jgi:hypothetical protein
MNQQDLILTEWKDLERTLASCILTGCQDLLARMRSKHWRPEYAQDAIDYFRYACSLPPMGDDQFIKVSVEWILQYQYFDQMIYWVHLTNNVPIECTCPSCMSDWALDGIKKLRYLQGSLDFLQELADKQSVY